jgi:transcriptional regulator with XRE-family HTH domain
MNQEKIGKFISQKRKERAITQSELAEKLGITDRAISKWENGICLPDAGNMPELCSILNITINDLFSGEIVDMKENEKRLEENLLEMTKLKEQKDKELLRLEIVIGTLGCTVFLFLFGLALLMKMDMWLQYVLIGVGFAVLIVATLFALRIEQVAGFYECANCHHKYVPTFKSVNLAPHMGRTRKMKCPKCGKRSWQKKVLK